MIYIDESSIAINFNVPGPTCTSNNLKSARKKIKTEFARGWDFGTSLKVIYKEVEKNRYNTEL